MYRLEHTRGIRKEVKLCLSVFEICCGQDIARNDGSGLDLNAHFNGNIIRDCRGVKTDTKCARIAKAHVRKAMRRIRYYHEHFLIWITDILSHIPSDILHIVRAYSLHGV
jgi:hypothetical protein